MGRNRLNLLEVRFYSMRIGLIDADLLWGKHASGRRYGNTKADIFPNLVLMKLSSYHKQMGDEVSMYYGVEEYDRVKAKE